MRERLRLDRIKYLNTFQELSLSDGHSLCRTRQLPAPRKVQVLHAHGKLQLRKVTCGKRRQRNEAGDRQEKGRRGERRRGGMRKRVRLAEKTY